MQAVYCSGLTSVWAAPEVPRSTCQKIIPEAKDWLLAQRRGSVTVSDVADREASATPCVLARMRPLKFKKCSQDCTEMHIPENCKGRRPRAVERVRGLGLREVLREAG